MIPKLNMRNMKMPKLPEKEPESWQRKKLELAQAMLTELQEINKKMDTVIGMLTAPETEE